MSLFLVKSIISSTQKSHTQIKHSCLFSFEIKSRSLHFAYRWMMITRTIHIISHHITSPSHTWWWWWWRWWCCVHPRHSSHFLWFLKFSTKQTSQKQPLNSLLHFFSTPLSKPNFELKFLSSTVTNSLFDLTPTTRCFKLSLFKSVTFVQFLKVFEVSGQFQLVGISANLIIICGSSTKNFFFSPSLVEFVDSRVLYLWGFWGLCCVLGFKWLSIQMGSF